MQMEVKCTALKTQTAFLIVNKKRAYNRAHLDACLINMKKKKA
jgi:hypothetical protein